MYTQYIIYKISIIIEKKLAVGEEIHLFIFIDLAKTYNIPQIKIKSLKLLHARLCVYYHRFVPRIIFASYKQSPIYRFVTDRFPLILESLRASLFVCTRLNRIAFNLATCEENARHNSRRSCIGG